MPPIRLLIFGNPKADTPLMLAEPSVAIDLSLKILVREDAEGNVWVSYNSPRYLQERSNLAAAVASEYRSGRDSGDEGCGIIDGTRTLT